MQAFCDIAVEQALEDSGLELHPNEFSETDLACILKIYFCLKRSGESHGSTAR